MVLQLSYSYWIEFVYICDKTALSSEGNENVHLYCPDIPTSSADCATYIPGIGTHSFYSLISYGVTSAIVP